MWELGEHFRNYANEYRDAVHEHFFNAVPESRQIFALSMRDTHTSLVPALAWVIEHMEPGQPLLSEVSTKLTQLARDHRRHGFPAEIYSRFEHALIAGLRVLALTQYQYDFARDVIHRICTTMAEAAGESDAAGEAPAHSAQVVAVDHPTRDTSIIRVEAGLAVPYQPGQHFPVTTQYLPGQWRMLTPAQPSDGTGQLVFHVSTAGEASRSLAHAQPGDWWTLGQPAGGISLHNADAEELIIIAYGTGWATARCVALAALDDGDHNHVPRIFAVAGSPGAHYDTYFQQNVAALGVRVRRIVREERDPWLLNARELAPGADYVVSGEPTDVVVNEVELSTGTPPRFLLVGPAEEVAEGKQELVKKGLNKQQIDVLSWGRDGRWQPEDYAALA